MVNITTKNTILKWVAGAFFALGSIGAFLPLLPTVPFWIVAAIIYLKADPKMAQKIFAHKQFGKIVENFVTYGIITRKSKLAAIGGAVFIGAISLYFMRHIGWLFWTGLIGMAIGVIFVATRPEQIKESNQN